MNEGLLSQATRLGPVHLKVTDIPAALTVWHDTLGLVPAGEDDATAGEMPLRGIWRWGEWGVDCDVVRV